MIKSIVKQIAKLAYKQEMITKIISIDGHGGAGKSTFAKKLSKELNNCPIIQTDDFASWDNPVNWFPRLIEQVLKPLSENRVANYQKFDWDKRALTKWITTEPQDYIIVEGVSSSRKEFREFLSFSIYIKTAREVCLERGLIRDGEDSLDQWKKWMKAEDEYISRDNPEAYANIVISGEA